MIGVCDDGVTEGVRFVPPIRIVTPGPAMLSGKLHWDGMGDRRWVETCCPYGAAGDRLWVRETFSISPPLSQRPIPNPASYPNVKFRATDERSGWDDGPWTPSIHMFRHASRLTLEVVDVRVERVQSITTEDCIAEGYGPTHYPASRERRTIRPIEWYEALWQSINAKRPGCSWADNPWVWVVTFKRVEA